MIYAGKSDEDVLRSTLDSVNAWRRRAGMPRLAALPRGRRKHPTECPLARSMPLVRMVGPQAFTPAGEEGRRFYGLWWEPGGRHILPAILVQFQHRFDEGAYPDLVEQWPEAHDGKRE